MDKKNRNIKNTGFTLIEIMVSVSIFSMVMVIVIGALLVLNDANKKAQALRAIVDNLNFAVEDMTRNIRTGKDYNCSFLPDSANPTAVTGSWGQNCDIDQTRAGVSALAFKGQRETIAGVEKETCYVYVFDKGTIKYNKHTMGVGLGDSSCEWMPNYRNLVDGDHTLSQLISPEVQINALKFFVFDGNSIPGSDSASQQPFVIITLSGEIDVSQYKFKTPFNIQTTVSQRSSE